MARTSGNDVVLDALLLRSAHRDRLSPRRRPRLRPAMDLDVGRAWSGCVRRASTLRWQPISPALATRRRACRRPRRGPAHRPLLRYRDGRPLTSRRYDHLWLRLGQQLPWVAAQGISTHWLRHTTLTWVERHYGYGIARAYAGHTDSTAQPPPPTSRPTYTPSPPPLPP